MKVSSICRKVLIFLVFISFTLQITGCSLFNSLVRKVKGNSSSQRALRAREEASQRRTQRRKRRRVASNRNQENQESLTKPKKYKKTWQQLQKEKHDRAKIEIPQLIKAEDDKTLETKYCEGKNIWFGTRQKACKGIIDIRMKRLLAKSDCTHVIQEYKKARIDSDWRMFKPYFHGVGYRLAKCKKWDFIMKQFANNTLVDKTIHMFKDLEKKGIRVEPNVRRWIRAQKKPFHYRHGWGALVTVGFYIIKKKNRRLKWRYCRYFGRLAWRAKMPKVQKWYIKYFGNARCTNARRYVTRQLSKRDPERRYLACQVLGQIGNSSSLRKLRIIARTDPASYTRRGYTNFYVRRACRASIGRIKLRR